MNRMTKALLLPVLLFLHACAATSISVTEPDLTLVPDGFYSLVLVDGDDDYETTELGAVNLQKVGTGDQMEIEGQWWLGDDEGDDLGGEFHPEYDGLYLTFTVANGTEHHLVGFAGPSGMFVAGHWTYWGTDGSWGNGLFRLDLGTID